jgi:hypothetical protein
MALQNDDERGGDEPISSAPSVAHAEERLRRLEIMASKLNADMPRDVMLKGDGSIWATAHGNDGAHPRRLTQQQVLELIYSAKLLGDQMISV